MQIGFRNGLFESSVRIHRLLDADIVLTSRKSIGASYFETFSREELYRTLGDQRVESVSPINWGLQLWRNPKDRSFKPILALGFEPGIPFLIEEELRQTGGVYNFRDLNIPGRIIFDTLSRAEYGIAMDDITSMRADALRTEIEGKEVRVKGLVRVGPSFGSDGIVLMSRETFARAGKDKAYEVELGLVRLYDPHLAEQVAKDLGAGAPANIRVQTKEQFIRAEKAYWMTTTAIGLIFNMGVILGIAGGIATIFQVLAANIVEHRDEYATLEAMGYGSGYVNGVVAKQGLILTVLGFFPGLVVAALLYDLLSSSTRLPIFMSWPLVAEIFIAVLAMNVVSGWLAVASTDRTDPAELLE